MTAAREDIFNLPNLLTLLRVGSIPLLVLFLYIPGPGWSRAAGALFFIAGLTDLLDGHLARRLKKVTMLGQYLDPVADKLLVSSVLIMLASLGRAPAWMAIVIICREIGVTGMRAVASSEGFTVPSDIIGKSKTAIQMLALLLLILHYPAGGWDLHFWGMAALWVSVIITAVSGGVYFHRFRQGLETHGPEKTES